MNNFLYPRDLYERLTKDWDSAPLGAGWPKVELPDASILNTFLDVCYHASFLVEEGRRIAFRAIYIDKDTSIRPPGASDSHPTALYTLDTPLPLNPKELCRLAPAADPTRVLIAVSQIEGLPESLQILGLVDIGSSLWDHARHQREYGHGLPQALIVTATKPGQLAISRGDKAIIRLVNGEPAISTKNLLLRGPIGEFFIKAEEWFIEEACKQRLRYQKESDQVENEDINNIETANEYSEEAAENGNDDDEQNDELTFAYGTILELILFSVIELGHGGTILIVPDELSHTDKKLQKCLNIKYALLSNRPQEVVLHKMAVRLLWQKQYGNLYQEEAITNSMFQDFDDLDHIQEDAVDSVADVARFIAGLTAVDGAVILTDKLRLIGFGAEVLAAATSLASVRSAESELADKFTEVPISAYGTRHRSAFRFCSSIEPSVAFIFSQDGGVKAIRKVGNNLIMWPYFEIGFNTGF